jgi:hypothetical protein
MNIFNQLIKSYYQMGIYTDTDLPLYVSVGWITQAEADQLKKDKAAA